MMLKQLVNFKCLYFGCIDRPGHYLFEPGSTPCRNRWERWASKRDGSLAPEFNTISGKALLHHFDGFTVVAFWDRSVDSRSGSNSMFIVPGIKVLRTRLR